MASYPDEDPGEGGVREQPKPIYNWMSLIGSAIFMVGATVTIFLMGIGLLTGDESGYAGLLLIIPAAIASFGALLVLAGWLRERRRQAHGRHSSFFERTVIEPFEIVKRTGLLAILGGVVVATFLLMATGAGSLAVVEYSESNEFCGEACHGVMGPEYTVYQHSPHARVECVECHVAPGGDSYLRAKIGGMRQLYAVATDTVSRPIPTPIHRRRLSDEMCGSCHNRERFIGYKTFTRTYYLNTEDPVPMRLGMLMKVGGGSSELVEGRGIHYHMLLAEKVEYIARDEQRQDIPWVRVVRPDGEVAIYSDESYPLTDEERASLEVREMECIDCHSRPAHEFPSPIDSVNQAMASGLISPKIPYIKEAAVRALDGGYETTPAALEGIEEALRSYYEENEEEVLETHADDLADATEALRQIYSMTIFPEMKADWRAHPDNLGHRDFPGCYRCHNDTMVNEDGDPLFGGCTSCHAVLAQDDSAISTMSDLDSGREFIHPEDATAFEEYTLCSDCHNGGSALYD